MTLNQNDEINRLLHEGYNIIPPLDARYGGPVRVKAPDGQQFVVKADGTTVPLPDPNKKEQGIA